MATDESNDIETLVDTIDEPGMTMRGDVTPAVLGLIQHGLPGALAVTHLLDGSARTTRVRAQRVVEGVAMIQHGWRPGTGYADRDGEAATQALVDEIGYDPDAPAERRRSAAAKWREWLRSREATR